MKGFLTKDRYLLNDYLFLYVFLSAAFNLILASLIGYMDDDRMYGGIMFILYGLSLNTVFVTSLVDQTLQSDEKCGFITNAFAQPALRKEYMLSKYVLAFILTGVFTGLEITAVIIGIILSGKVISVDVMLTILEIFVIGILGAVSVSFNSINVFIRFGSSKKGKIPKLIVTLPQMFIIFFCMKEINHDYVSEELALLFPDRYKYTSYFVPFFIVTILSFAVSIILMPIGFKWAEKKEV